MKKFLSIALLLAMIATCFAGCGSKQGSLGAVAEAEAVGFDATTAGVSTELKNAVTNYTAGTAWDGETIDETWYNAEAEVKTATLADAADLAGFVSLVNKGTTFAGWTIELGADINLGGKAWTPGSGSFSGTFDGKNHVISSYTVTQAKKTTGFFGNLVGDATFKNVALIDGTYTASFDFFGVAFGKTDGETGTEVNIQNIYYDATINATVDKNGYGLIGSCTGTNTVNISNFEANGTFTSDVAAGRVGASNGETSSSCNVNISNSISNVDYSGKGAYDGGFVGRFNSAGKLTVTNCLNTGDIYCNGNGIGGIVGYQQQGYVEIYNCKNEGNLSAITRVGGIIGGQRPGASYSKGTIISDSVNTGTLAFVSGDNWGIGSIIGGGLSEAGGSAANVLTLKNCTAVPTATIPLVSGNKANVELVGYQTTAPVEGAYDLRYVATLNPGAADVYAGFTVTVKYTEDGTTVSTKIAAQDVLAPNAYKSIKGTGAAGEETYAAADFGAEYLYTLVITGIPEAYTVENGKLEVTITPFTSADMESKTASYTVVDGAVVISAGA